MLDGRRHQLSKGTGGKGGWNAADKTLSGETERVIGQERVRLGGARVMARVIAR